ncbi:MAG: tRNA (5-methylaminomethyl-2-thiouridine)(34)-methyltransferase MnmD [Bacteroidetes bacterium]|nr:tRNA (5-methylaminomethyl-2-thiouridine)(34)-methyltransferase MnmD [Bacteroidota bacterium]MBU1579073.1 tRNA (5-methylaminomethyl-2-thiouridine)(34)-methyltransferase MnmD [Bacteroidota bacterium]MBU2556459.1 tRNA (5-methylaminomethyl-2-thiouridine)(34)-methyltransferase MnmD [Bacteroidota bacterium]
MANRKLIVTADGSTSIFDGATGESFHSVNGAYTESMLVFIENGLEFRKQQAPSTQYRILEIGFGTGLNAWLSLKKGEEWQQLIDYTAIEAFPLEMDLATKLNFIQNAENHKNDQYFMALHTSVWGETVPISTYFTLTKLHQNISDYQNEEGSFDVIYFDAFSPNVQPELWTEEIFLKLYHSLKSGGVLVTYSARGDVKNALRSVGFIVKRLPGPPGKRHVIRVFR